MISTVIAVGFSAEVVTDFIQRADRVVDGNADLVPDARWSAFRGLLHRRLTGELRVDRYARATGIQPSNL